MMDFLLTWSNINLLLLDLPLFPFDLSFSPFSSIASWGSESREEKGHTIYGIYLTFPPAAQGGTPTQDSSKSRAWLGERSSQQTRRERRQGERDEHRGHKENDGRRSMMDWFEEKLRYLMAEIKLFIRDPSNLWVKHVSIKTDAFQ
jgi:hypothetical protein